jgi:hypothetical protein
MDISWVIEAMKKEPGFSKNVGMVLVHTGEVRGRGRVSVVRAWSRKTIIV